MILHFSATGNNKYVAEQIAKAIGEQAVSMERFTQTAVRLKKGERLGIVVPTYFLELPPNVVSFLRDVTFMLSEDTYVFGVVTYGSTSGASGAHLQKILREKGIQTDSLFSILTPDTWTIAFDLSNAEKVKRTLNKTEEQLSRTISAVSKQHRGDFRTRQLPFLVTKFSDPFYQKARHTSHFRVENSCIGCELCEKNCPVRAIEIKSGKPVWTKEQCLACLRCLHSCPAFAIQYDGKTALHGQYRHEKYTGNEKE